MIRVIEVRVYWQNFESSIFRNVVNWVLLDFSISEMSLHVKAVKSTSPTEHVTSNMHRMSRTSQTSNLKPSEIFSLRKWGRTVYQSSWRHVVLDEISLFTDTRSAKSLLSKSCSRRGTSSDNARNSADKLAVFSCRFHRPVKVSVNVPDGLSSSKNVGFSWIRSCAGKHCYFTHSFPRNEIAFIGRIQNFKSLRMLQWRKKCQTKVYVKLWKILKKRSVSS